MATVISISNHKGGVGKTTTTVNIGAGLAMKGYKVLLVDLDAQANLTQSIGGNANAESNIYTMLVQGTKPEAQPTYLDNMHLLPATLDLSAAEIELSAKMGREYLLAELLAGMGKVYDYILIDTPPSLGLLTINALVASKYVIIPMQPHYLALQGLSKLVDVVTKIQARLNPALSIGAVIISQYDGRKLLNRDIADAIRKHFGPALLPTTVRNNIALAEAPAACQDIFTYAPGSNGAQDYKAILEELLTRIQ